MIYLIYISSLIKLLALIVITNNVLTLGDGGDFHNKCDCGARSNFFY
jgi:hypothetical protein